MQTANALVTYCIGLPAFAAVGVLTRTFYALGDTRVPVRASFVSVALNLILNLLFIGPLRGLGLGHVGLALATSLTAITNLLQLAWALRARIGSLDGRRTLDTLARVSLAAAIAVAPCALALWWSADRWHRGAVSEAIVVLAGLVVSLGIGIGAMKLLRVQELETFASLLGTLRRRVTG